MLCAISDMAIKFIQAGKCLDVNPLQRKFFSVYGVLFAVVLVVPRFSVVSPCRTKV